MTEKHKIKISEVEDYLDKNIKRNHISLGFDVSVHSTGAVIVRTKNEYLILEVVTKLITPNTAKNAKAQDIYTEQLDDYRNKVSQKFSLNTVIIEDCFYGKNVDTLKALARCSGLARDRFKNLADRCEYMYPKTIRKEINCNTHKLKGYQLKKYIVTYINEALSLKLKAKDNDIADAIACALAGLIDYEV